MDPEFGKRLKFLRIEKGLRQLDLARLTGLSEQKICKFETGRQEPKSEEVEKIWKALGVESE